MEIWRYKSLEWIHKVREEDFNQTKNLSPKEIIEKTREAAKDIADSMGLEIVHTDKRSVH